MDENNPDILEKKMYKAFEFANMKEEGLPDSIVQNPGFQEQMAKFLEKVPTAKFLINQSEDGLYRFNRRPRTLDEEKAKLYPSESAAETALRNAQKAEHEATTAKTKEETLWIKPKTEAEIAELGKKRKNIMRKKVRRLQRRLKRFLQILLHRGIEIFQ
jgi:hypothetical protein